MIEINGKHFCENCFEETITSACPRCGYDSATSANDPTMLMPGSILLGKYIIGKVIGKGGFGVTYLAYDTAAGRKAAIKEFFPYGVALRAAGSTTVSVASMDNAEAFKLGAEKFYDEAKLVSKFNGNPNIVGVYEFFYENDTVYFAMEYLKGRTLKDYINEHGVLTAPQALFIAENVANALMAAHSSAVLHRDISPDNIILCDNGGIKLIDFGAARQVVAEHSQSFSVILKPGFAPLEQYQKKGNQGPWTDIYSLGATVYFALTGDIPEDPMSRLDDDTAFASNQYGVNSELWDIIHKSTMLRIDERYGDIFALKNDLNRVSFKSEPVIVPAEAEEQKPEFRTAMPFGMTQGVPSAQQPAAGAVSSNPPPNNMTQAGEIYQQNANPVQPNGAYPDPPIPTKKKGFFRRHLAAVIAVSGIAAASIAAAVIVPIVGKMQDSANAMKNDYGSSYSDGSVSSDKTNPPKSTAPDTTSAPITSAPEQESPNQNTELSSKMFYLMLSELSGEYKTVYEAIYSGLKNRQTQINLPANVCANEDINIIYYMVLYENPQFYYVSDCKIGSTLDPTYLPETNADSPGKVINSYYAGKNTDDTIETLCAVHDMLIKNTEIVPRYSTGTCTSAYGALVDGRADDLGLAKAFCYYAQELGLSSYVVDGTYYGEPRAWVRVYIDGVWYNVDVYGDKDAGSAVNRIKINESEGGCFHTYFLTNDTYIKNYGYTPNEEYEVFWAEGRSADSSKGNYYIERSKTYIDSSAEKAYNRLVDTAVSTYYESDSNNSAKMELHIKLYVAPFLIDELVDKMNESLFYDLKEKYGITATNATMDYQPDLFTLTVII